MRESNNKPESSTKRKRQRRPIVLTLMFWIFALWTALGFFRFARVITDRALLLERLTPGLWLYLLIAGLIWGLLGLPVLWGIYRRMPWAPKLIWIASGVYPALYWLERVFLWRDPFARRDWPFMLLLTCLWFAMILISMRSKRIKMYFNPEDQLEEG